MRYLGARLSDPEILPYDKGDPCPGDFSRWIEEGLKVGSRVQDPGSEGPVLGSRL